ncbi:MAG: hypothetical protein ACO27G_07010, partial [Bacteroidia bacterium]
GLSIYVGDSLRCRANLNAMFGDYDFDQFAINDGKTIEQQNALQGVLANQQNVLLESFRFVKK